MYSIDDGINSHYRLTEVAARVAELVRFIRNMPAGR